LANKSLADYLDFQRNVLKMSEPALTDLALKQQSELAFNLVYVDFVSLVYKELRADRHLEIEAFRLFRSHDILSGRKISGFREHFGWESLARANRFLSVRAGAHMYHLLRVSRRLKSAWEGMDDLLELQDLCNLFAGHPMPQDVHQSCKRCWVAVCSCSAVISTRNRRNMGKILLRSKNDAKTLQKSVNTLEMLFNPYFWNASSIIRFETVLPNV
jgi:hypothetical protein